MKRKQSIELLRLISIFFVVIIHNGFTSYFGFAIDTMSRFAVPIFFMITGYFVIQSNNTLEKLKKQITKLVKYYIFYELIYIIYYFILALLEKNLVNFISDFKSNIKHILINPIFGHHLWYLINIIWVLIIIYIFEYFKKQKILFISSIILHLIGIFISNLSLQLIHKTLPLSVTRNFLFFSLFYVLIGSYIRKIDINKIKFNNYIILIFSISMCIFQIVERYLYIILFNSNFQEYFITTIFASIGIFIFTLKSNINNKIIKKISSYSMPIFFLHILVINLLSQLIHYAFHVNLDMIRANFVENFIFIIIVCIFSSILYDVSKKTLQLLYIKIISPIRAII